MNERHKRAYEYIRKYTDKDYPIGIILGTGLGGLVQDIEIEKSIEYTDIPEFPQSTVESHHGKLIFGRLSSKPIVAMQGRFHFYEGYSHETVTFPIHIFKALGVRYIIVSNACGALNPKFRKTDLMIITSHINLHYTNPLIDYRFNKNNGNNFYYSKELISIAEETALEYNIEVQKGVYATVQGPNLETKAELRMIKKMGADVVGMSTVPEAIVANKMGIQTLGLSIITDEGFPDTLVVAKLEHILKAASIAEPKLTLLTKKFIENLKIRKN